jgi:hypothetical protein
MLKRCILRGVCHATSVHRPRPCSRKRSARSSRCEVTPPSLRNLRRAILKLSSSIAIFSGQLKSFSFAGKELSDQVSASAREEFEGVVGDPTNGEWSRTIEDMVTNPSNGPEPIEDKDKANAKDRAHIMAKSKKKEVRGGRARNRGSRRAAARAVPEGSEAGAALYCDAIGGDRRYWPCILHWATDTTLLGGIGASLWRHMHIHGLAPGRRARRASKTRLDASGALAGGPPGDVCDLPASSPRRHEQ